MNKLKQYFTSHPLESVLLIIILIYASFIRLNDIRDYMVFLGDQGRDVLIVRDILTKVNMVYIGPTASVGGFFLGPFYYYLIAPALLLSNFDPVGPAILVALFSITTTVMCYYFGRRYFSPISGILAAAIFAVSRLVVEYSRSSWNPNVLPFFSLLLIIGLARILESNSQKIYRWFFVIGSCLGIIIQLHYQAVAMHIVTLIVLLIYAFKLKKQENFAKILSKQLSVLFIGILLFLGPFILFEIYHQFPNTQNIYRFVFQGSSDGFSGGRSYEFILRDTSYRLFLRLVAGGSDTAAQIAIFTTIVGLILAVYIFFSRFYVFIKKSRSPASFINDFNDYFSYALNHKRTIGLLILSIWFICGVGVWGVYKKSIFDYYFSYMYPLPILLFSSSVSILIQFRSRRFEKNNILPIKVVGFFALFIFVIGLLAINIKEVQSIKPGEQVKRTEWVAREIIKRKTNGPYNFALLTPGNSDHAYRYFLDVYGNPPTKIDDNITNQLMVFCESNRPPCEPEGNSLWEVAGFGRSSIVGQWEVIGLPLYRLEHIEKSKYLEGNPAPKGGY